MQERVIHFLPTANVGGLELSVLRLYQLTRDLSETAVFKCQGPAVGVFRDANVPTMLLDTFRRTYIEQEGKQPEKGTILHLHAYRNESIYHELVSELPVPALLTLHWKTRFPFFDHPIVCVSRGTAEIQHRENKVVLLMNGVDTDAFRPPAQRPGDRLVICRISRPKKVDPSFWRVVDLVLQAREDVEFWVVGEEGDSTDRIKYLGTRTDVDIILREASILVHCPMPEEGAHDLVVLEAMCSGVCVVAYDVACVRESFTRPEDMRLVPFGEVEAMAGEILSLLADEQARADMGRKARETVLRSFDIRDKVTEYRRIYRELLTENPEPNSSTPTVESTSQWQTVP